MTINHFKNGFMLLVLLTSIGLSSCKKDVPDRDQFIGTFQGTSSCDPGNTLILIITASPLGSDAIVLTDQDGDSVNATVSGKNLSIPLQVVNRESISGSGSISGNTLTLVFKSGTDSCTATLQKK